MDKRTFVGLCAALAFVAGSPGAYALKIFDTVPGNKAAVMAGMDSFTYAAETLMTDAVTDVEDDSTTYYNIRGTSDDNLVLSAPADIGATAGDIYVVAITLDGMVFRGAQLGATALGGGAFGVATGGAPGDKLVVYRLTGGAIDGATGFLSLTAQFAVSKGGGSATLTMTNQTLVSLDIADVSGTVRHSGNVIKVASALKETPMANDLTAEVVSSFKKFEGGMTIGTVGSLAVGVEGHRTASDGIAVANLEAILQNEGTAEEPDSSVSFMGDFSFASKVFVHGDDDCGGRVDPENVEQSLGVDTDLAADEMDIRVMEGEDEDAVVTDTTMAVSLDANGTDQAANVSWMNYLCIMVQGDDTEAMVAPKIPDTDAYTAMGSYKALEMAANGPMGVERMLGEIARDGTTVHIPYMTTYDGYNQRLVLSNRGNADAPYEIEFRPEEGTTATVLEDANGTLMANTTVTMKATDLVELEPGTRTAATIILEAQPGKIDVTSVIVNKESQDTDTVVHHSE